MQTKIAILGSGAMATACSVLLAEHGGRTVSIWARSAERAAELARDRENRRLLPGVPIPDSVTVTHSIETASEGADLLVPPFPPDICGRLWPRFRRKSPTAFRLSASPRGWKSPR